MKRFILLAFASLLLCIQVGCSPNKVSDNSSTDDNSLAFSSVESVTDEIDNSPEASSNIISSVESKDNTVISSAESEISSSIGKEYMNNCKLIVRGKDISSKVYVHFNEERCAAELPLLAIVKELGATVQWQDETKVTITFNGHSHTLDTSKSDFGMKLPPGSRLCVRKVIDGEVVMDDTSIRGLVRWVGAGAIIEINIEQKIIEIQ